MSVIQNQVLLGVEYRISSTDVESMTVVPDIISLFSYFLRLRIINISKNLADSGHIERNGRERSCCANNSSEFG